MTKNECYECGRKDMKVTSVTAQASGAIIWCQCPDCGFRDDIIVYYDIAKKQ
ncbi:hypothetical protein [Aminobacterium colombiense]|uniref:hypothetical protein n=1 Tax=Aminobacterium colombiense TaxID=81468 RepID=UPI002591B296|nr:hypothetical protein [uncultured Aminobacterium sp.]